MRNLLGVEVGRGRSDGLDVLRALLALWVVVSHLGPWSGTGWLAWIGEHTTLAFISPGQTHPAVLMFIVLSGYCIHRSGARFGQWSVRGYTIRRAFRILPVYFLALALGATLFALLQGHAQEVAMSSTSSITPGCLTAKATGIPAFVPSLIPCSYQGNGPLDTVMIEIWLYVVYGIAATLLVRRWLSERAFWAVLVVVVGAGLVYADSSADKTWWQGSLLGFLLYWWIGAAAVGRSRWPTIPAVAAWFAVSAVYWSGQHGFILGETRKVALAVAVAGGIRLLDLAAWKLPATVTVFGRSGYSIYAFHAPIVMALIVLGAPWWACILAVLVVALLSYTFVEKPLLGYARALAKRQPAARSEPVLSTQT